MINDTIKANLLACQVIPNVNEDLIEELGLSDTQRSLGIISADSDDVAYVALDAATKAAQVDVVYAKSLYAGADNANTKLAGEVIGIIAGDNPEEIKSGLKAIEDCIENDASFYSANNTDDIIYFAYTVSRTGTFLSKEAGINEGESLAYLIAPPVEAMVGLDLALKAADVKLVTFYGPPSETNFGGGLLTGSQSACKAACDAFASGIRQVASNPKVY